ncbi:UNVERIFIED_CONTAM: Retrovirus-related Pol polyprotein from transposon [Sesamum indicum]
MFAWDPSDIRGIDPEVIVHRLKVNPSVRPVQQKKRTFGGEKNNIIKEELNKLLKAGYVSEVQYTDWLANVVLVPKATGKWRMCTDFTDLYKACPKDPYPLPRIDLLVDSTAGYEVFSMMDAYQGHHQIYMAIEGRVQMSFVSDRGIFCYNVMPFRLKNAGATYQRLVNKMFAQQIEKTMEVYVDDMLVKSQKLEDHSIYLKATFAIMRKYGMKLNPSKCTFGVGGGKFLGYMVSERGIEANSEKIEAILRLKSPTSLKEVQKLSAFQELKNYLKSPPLLPNPREGDTLYLYLAVSDNAVSSVLIKEENKIQNPVYYVSRMLQGAEKRYTEIEKLALALIVTAKKLRPYFQSHKIVVMTNHPLQSILSRPEASGKMIKWAVELGEFDISYQKTSSGSEEPGIWMLHVDGSSNTNNGGAGILIEGPGGIEIEVAAQLSFLTTNNEAEYEALILGLELAFEAGAQILEVFTDSQLVAMQIEGTYENKEKSMQIPRIKNERANALSKFGALLAGIKDRRITIMIKERSAISKSSETNTVSTRCPWIEEITTYLLEGTLPNDLAHARRIKVKAPRFTLIGTHLYKRTVEEPLLKCLDDYQESYVLREIHESSCGNHSGARSLAQKVTRQGYFCPMLLKDSKEFVQRCEKCQKYASQIHTPAVPMIPISITCSFDQWGIDILGPFPPARAQKKFGIPRVLISDNATQFQGRQMTSWLRGLKIQQNFTAVGHPQANGEIENDPEITEGSETPFSLVYGSEVVIPTEIGEESQRIMRFDPVSNQEQRAFDLDMVEERRDAA